MADPNSPDGPRGIYVLPEAETSHIQNKILDISYATGSVFQKLDLYFPDSEPPAEGYPLILFIHGGAWMMCDKNDIQLQPSLSLLDHGYAVASVNYRLSGESLFPAQIHDVKAAVRWLRSYGREHCLNTEKIAAWGDSAGAHLASLLGTTDGIPEMEDLSMGNENSRSSVEAVVSWFGPTDFLSMDKYLMESGTGEADHTTSESPESKLLGALISEIPEAVLRANPETWIRRGQCPPFLLQHGLKDPLVPYQLSRDFADRLRSEGGVVDVVLDLLPEALHGGDDFETPENIGKVITFLDRYIK